MKLKSFLSCAVASVTLAFSASCAGQEAAGTDTMPANAQPGPALWKVSDEDTNVYLFGTVHVLPREVEWFDGRIERAFNSSDVLVTEIGLEDMAGMQQVITETAMLQGDQTLRQLMTDENRQQYEAALGQFGIPLETFDKVEPWMAAMTLSILPLQASGYSAESGVELALSGRATGKTRASLETIEEQIGLFDTLPMDAQLTYLDETVEAIPEGPAKLQQMIAEWLGGDAATLAQILNDEMDDPALYARLLTDRNANWAEWIDERMASPGNLFIAVGAGHLAGTGSVQEQLEERGYEVERVWE